jgi:hypothetical protein
MDREMDMARRIGVLSVTKINALKDRGFIRFLSPNVP